jgi:hypothetical protein
VLSSPITPFGLMWTVPPVAAPEDAPLAIGEACECFAQGFAGEDLGGTRIPVVGWAGVMDLIVSSVFGRLGSARSHGRGRRVHCRRTAGHVKNGGRRGARAGLGRVRCDGYPGCERQSRARDECRDRPPATVRDGWRGIRAASSGSQTTGRGATCRRRAAPGGARGSARTHSTLHSGPELPKLSRAAK